MIKVFGYIPLVNIAAGIFAFVFSNNETTVCGPHHALKWKVRSIAMIFTGPLLLVVDLIKCFFDQKIASKYISAHPELIAAFNLSHRHNVDPSPWPGHPVYCIQV